MVVSDFVIYFQYFCQYYDRKGEMTLENILIIALMYITYSQMWLVVAAYGMVMYIKEMFS